MQVVTADSDTASEAGEQIEESDDKTMEVAWF